MGSHLVESLIRDGYAVHAVGRDGSKRENIAPGAQFHSLSIQDMDAVRALYASTGPDEVYHLAMSPLQMGKTEGPQKLIETNVLGTASVMDALSEIPEARLVYTGSFTETGGKDRAVREDDIPEPPELYSVTKLSGTLYGQALARAHKRNILIGRIFTPYGPRVQKGRLVDTVLRACLSGESLALSSPQVSRDFIYVTDIVAALREFALKADTLRGEVFNIGTGKQTTLEQLVALSKDITHSSSTVSWSPETQVSYDAFPWRADMRKTFGTFSWRPNVSLEEGLRETVAWMKS